MARIPHFSRLFSPVLRNISALFLRYWKIWGFRVFLEVEFSAEIILKSPINYGTENPEISGKCGNSAKYAKSQRSQVWLFGALFEFGAAIGACFLTLCYFDSEIYVQIPGPLRNYTRKRWWEQAPPYALFCVSWKSASYFARRMRVF